jgi:hypothetical protein
MDPVSLIVSVVQMISSVPVVGKFLAPVLGVLVGASAVVTALVGVWHAVVSAITALAALPGLSGMAGLAKSLQADSAVIDADSNQLLSWIERFSAIPVPQVAQKPQA